MKTELTYLAFSVVLGIVQLLAAGMTATAQRGPKWNVGNRDGNPKPLEGLPGRLSRAFDNFKETFPFFAAAVFLVVASDRHSAWSAIGAQLYFWARLAYFPVYAFGIPVVRSLVWVVSMIGIALLLLSLM